MPPRVPRPPRWRSRCVQPRTRRVERYSSWASSTCSLPSWLRARRPNISRIRRVRSTTGHPSAFARLRSCAGVRSWLKTTISARCSRARRLISLTFPEPANRAGSGRARRPRTRASGAMPALTARSLSSSRRSSPPSAPISRPTRTAREAPDGRSGIGHGGNCAARRAHQLSAECSMEKLTARPGTTVEIACL